MKKIQKYRKLILKGCLLSVLMINATSCTKGLLEPVPITSIPEANAFDTPERIVAQINGLYAAMKTGNFYGGRLIIYNELRGDEFIMNKPNLVTGQSTWSQNVSAGTSEVASLWSAGYNTINKVNTFLVGLDLNKSKISTTLYANYAGEAKFVRALCYFAMLQMYAQPYQKDNGVSPGLVIRLLPENNTDHQVLARSTVAQTYALILQDLNDAEAGLPLVYSGSSAAATASLNTTRANRNSAIALKSRVYLVKGDYASVLTECAKIVPAAPPFVAPSGVANKMEASVATPFGGAYVGPEAVFSLPMTATENPGGQNSLAYYWNISPGNAEFYLNPAGTLSDPVFATASADARKNFILTSTGQKWLTKFKQPSTFHDYIPVIRYPEVLLNYAEAFARAGDAISLTRARALLAAVRNRSDASYVFPALATTTQAALINTILQEKKIEFLGEGFRAPDLQRLLATLPGKTSSSGSAPAVTAAEGKYIWPIPASETSVNTAVVQNPQ